MSTTNLCFERSNLSLSAHLSLNFSRKEFASGIESVNELILDEINEITSVANDEINENYNGDKVQNSVANFLFFSIRADKYVIKALKNKYSVLGIILHIFFIRNHHSASIKVYLKKIFLSDAFIIVVVKVFSML